MFRLFGIPVRVHPLFFLTAVFIGLGGAQMGGDQWLTWLALWVALVFVGVLAHELGHAFAGRVFGLVPSIELYAFGGLTWWREGRPLDPWRSIAVSLAGPLVGIVAGGLGWWFLSTTDLPAPSVERFALWSFVWINLGWGVLNLVPMLPLDGGNIMASFFELFTRRNGRRFARYLSIALAVGLAAWALAFEQWFFVALLAFLAWNNVRDLRTERQMRDLLPYQPVLERAYTALADGDALGVLGPAQQLAAAEHSGVQAEGQLLVAWGALLRGDAFGARAALDRVPGAVGEDSALTGALLLMDGDEEGALRHFQVIGPSAVEQARLGAAFMASDRYDVAVRHFSQAKHRDQAVVGRLARKAEAKGATREAVQLRQMSVAADASSG
jgi:Zn-dependent protease